MRSDPALGPLSDIASNIDLAREFLGGLSFDEFQKDTRTSYAVIRCLEIISEASRRLPAELKARHPQIEWSEIAAAGSIYRHAYEIVRNDLIWRTVSERLEPLHRAIEAELNRFRNR